MIFALLISSALACNSWISPSEADRIMAGEKGPFNTTCVGESCECYDKVDWEVAERGDEEVAGPNIVIVTQRQSCETREECVKKHEELVCLPGHRAIRTANPHEVYCYKSEPGPMVKTGRRILKNNAAKLAAKALKQQLEEDKRQAKKQAAEELKALDVDKITTIKDLKAVVKKLMEAPGVLD